MNIRRKRVGFLVNHLGWEGLYTNRLWRAALVCAERRGIDLVVFTGPQDASDFLEQSVQTAVFRMVNPRRLDGLILNPGIKYYMDAVPIPVFSEEFRGIPMISIAETLPEIPSVVIDNFGGMCDLVNHLVQVHGRRKQAFICGPTNSEDARIRLVAWSQTLRSHGLEVNPDLIFAGDYIMVAELDKLVARWKMDQPFDAVVAASDLMAYQVIQALRQAGIQVPQDVSVVGFDDNPQNRYYDPPLTSVNQPIEAQVEAAFKCLDELWVGQCPAAVTELSSQLRVRASCGCPEAGWSIDPALKGALDSFLGSTDADFAMSDELLQHGQNYADLAFDAWHALGGILPDAASRQRLDQIQAQLFFNSIQKLRIPSATNPLEEQNRAKLGRKLMLCSDLKELADLMENALPSVGIESFCLSVQPKFALSDHFVNNTEVVGTDVNGPDADGTYIVSASLPKMTNACRESRFLPTLLAPDSWFASLERTDHMVLPIVACDAWIGILLIQLKPQFQELILQIQAALSLVCDREIKIRRALRLNQSSLNESLLSAERIRTVGTLVRGVAHEVNTPLGISVTLGSWLQEKLDEFSSRFAHGKLTKQYLDEFINGGREGIEGLNGNLNRVAELIQVFKKVSVTQYSDSAVQSDLQDEVRHVCQLLNSELKARFIRLEIVADAPMPVTTLCVVLNEIITHLIRNAIDHAFPKGSDKEPIITIAMGEAAQSGDVFVKVADNGVGFSKAVKSQIFDPFFSTNQAAGHLGLGLAIVANLVNDCLCGKIECESSIDSGTEFVITFARHF